jgi:hypothetical protein
VQIALSAKYDATSDLDLVSSKRQYKEARRPLLQPTHLKLSRSFIDQWYHKRHEAWDQLGTSHVIDRRAKDYRSLRSRLPVTIAHRDSFYHSDHHMYIVPDSEPLWSTVFNLSYSSIHWLPSLPHLSPLRSTKCLHTDNPSSRTNRASLVITLYLQAPRASTL